MNRKFLQKYYTLPKQIALSENEEVIFVEKPSPAFSLIVVVVPLPLILIAIIVTLIKKPPATLFFLVFYALLVLLFFLPWRFTYYILTDKQLIKLKGILRKDFISIDLRKVQDIRIKQGIEQRLFKCGTISITTAGTAGVEMKWENVSNPWEIHRKIKTAVEQAKRESA